MLINCIECNAQISDSVKECPQCGLSPEGLKCKLCGLEGAPSKMFGFSYDSPEPLSYPDGGFDEQMVKTNMSLFVAKMQMERMRYHNECIKSFEANYLNLSLSNKRCPECNITEVSSIWTSASLLTVIKDIGIDSVPNGKCKSCGFNFSPLDVFLFEEQCFGCELAIFAELHGYCEEFHEQQRNGTTEIYSLKYHHPLCSPSEDDNSKDYLKRLYYARNKNLEKEIISEGAKTLEKESNKSLIKPRKANPLLTIVLLVSGIVVVIYIGRGLLNFTRTDTATTQIINSSTETRTAGTMREVNTIKLNMRSGAGANYSVVATFPKKSRIVSYGETRNVEGELWTQASTPDGKTRGWVNRKFLSP